MKRGGAAGIAGFMMIWIFMVILAVLLIQVRNYFGANPIFRPRLDVREAFQGASGPQDAAVPYPEEAGEGQSPAPAELEKMADPYALLKGWLPTGVDTVDKIKLNAQGCYEGDFQTRLERTGNYRQLTNNYKRGSPDSCTAPFTELVLPFYKTEPIPAMGCL